MGENIFNKIFKRNEEENLQGFSLEQQKRIKKIDRFVNSLPKNTFRSIETQFSGPIFGFDKDQSPVLPIIGDKLKESKVIDLGFGGQNFIFDFVKNMGAKEYVGVDINKYEHLKKIDTDSQISAEIIQEDMLKYVARQPDSSAQFFLNGIDFDIISNKEYWNYLVDEIHRATINDGLFIGTNFEYEIFLDKNKENPLFRKIFKDGYTVILQKNN